MYVIGTVKMSDGTEVDVVMTADMVHKYRSILHALKSYHEGVPPSCDTIIEALEEMLPLWKIIELTETDLQDTEAQCRVFLFQTVTDTFVCDENDLSHAIIVGLLEVNNIKPLDTKELQKFIYEKTEDE